MNNNDLQASSYLTERAPRFRRDAEDALLPLVKISDHFIAMTRLILILHVLFEINL